MQVQKNQNRLTAATVVTDSSVSRFLEDTEYRICNASDGNKKLSYRRGTARCVVSVEILPSATQQCRNYLYDKS